MSKMSSINIFILWDRVGTKPEAASYTVQFLRVQRFMVSLSLRYHCKKTQKDQTMFLGFFFLVLFFCTKNIQWVLGLKGEER